MFRARTQRSTDAIESTPPTRGLNNSGGTGVLGASTSDRAGSLSPSSAIPATVQGRADIRGVEQLVARLAHNQEVAGSNPAPATNRNPLTDPRTGDIVTDEHGVVLEVVDAVLGHGAHVHVREDSSRYRCSHDAWRTITAGGRVIHAAEGQS